MQGGPGLLTGHRQVHQPRRDHGGDHHASSIYTAVHGARVGAVQLAGAARCIARFERQIAIIGRHFLTILVQKRDTFEHF